MRSILGMLVLVLLLAPAGIAGEEKAGEEKAGEEKAGAGQGDPAASISPEHVARCILEGRQTFIAQYLQQASAAELLKIQQAICKLAPEVVDQARAQPQVPSVADAPDGPVELVNIEVRLLGTTQDSSFFEDGEFLPSGSASVKLLDDAEVDIILRAVEKSQGVRQITAPRITVYDRQRAEVSMLEQISYVEDYDIEVAGDAFLGDPIVGVASEGLVLDVRPILSEDRKHVSLELGAMHAEIRKPIPEHVVDCRGVVAGQKVRIQVPQTDLRHLRVSSTLPSGGTLLIRTQMTLGEGPDTVKCFVLVRATVVEMDGATLKQGLRNVEKELKAGPKKRAGKPVGK